MIVVETTSRTWRASLGLVLSLLAGLVLGGTALARSEEKPKTAEDVLKSIQGTWNSDADGIDSTWTFTGDKVKANINGQEYSCKIKIDPAAKPHTTIDLAIDEGPDGSSGKDSKAIYKFDGEKLILCASAPGKDRPKDFEQTPDEAYLFVLKKEKK